jgi:catechol 2,3-dioxygenase-like lactoylglutathione lyase family enzyme
MPENDPPTFPDPTAVASLILVVSDLDRTKRFWTEVLGAELYREYGGTTLVLRLAGSWVLLVTGGAPTADKPTVTFAPPPDPDRVSVAITLRVADCRTVYETLLARGGVFLTPPVDHGGEIRCFLRDPDGHLIELSEAVGR